LLTLHRIAILATLQLATADMGGRLAQRCAALTGRPSWRVVGDEALSSPGLKQFREAI
jgi:hypothetical protein